MPCEQTRIGGMTMIKKGDKVRIIATGRVGRVVDKWWSWFSARYTIEFDGNIVSYGYTDDDIEPI